MEHLMFLKYTTKQKCAQWRISQQRIESLVRIDKDPVKIQKLRLLKTRGPGFPLLLEYL